MRLTAVDAEAFVGFSKLLSLRLADEDAVFLSGREVEVAGATAPQG